MNTLAVVPARGGSKAVLQKNIAPLAGRPLISYAVSAARQCPEITRLICSTDDDQIAEVAQEYGAEVPFRRPAELCSDSATLIPVAHHALRAMEELDGCRYDLLVTVQPTCPLVRPETISSGIRSLAESDADALIAVYNATHLYWRVDGEGHAISLNPKRVNRQDMEPIYRETGVVAVTRREHVTPTDRLGRKLLLMAVSETEALDIDDYADMHVAELLILGQRLMAGDGPPEIVGVREI